MGSEQQEVRDALARLERALEVGFARLSGRVDVVIQRLDQQDRRTDDHAQQIASLDQRLDVVERDAVTRQDLEQRQAASARTVTIVVSIIAIVAGTGTGVLTSVLT